MYMQPGDGQEKANMFEFKEKHIACPVITRTAKCWMKWENKDKYNLFPLYNHHKLQLFQIFS